MRKSVNVITGVAVGAAVLAGAAACSAAPHAVQPQTVNREPDPGGQVSDGPDSGAMTTMTPSPPALPTIMNQNRVYVVGRDIAPGSYTTNGEIGMACYYATLSSADVTAPPDPNAAGGIDPISGPAVIEQHVTATQPATVTLGGQVKAFETINCLPWYKN